MILCDETCTKGRAAAQEYDPINYQSLIKRAQILNGTDWPTSKVSSYLFFIVPIQIKSLVLV